MRAEPSAAPRRGKLRIGIAARRHVRQPSGMASELPPLPAGPTGGLYRHYKGNLYRVLGLARHSETLEPMVVYQALYGEGGTWVRPAQMWSETVEVAGRRVVRFERVGE